MKRAKWLIVFFSILSAVGLHAQQNADQNQNQNQGQSAVQQQSNGDTGDTTEAVAPDVPAGDGAANAEQSGNTSNAAGLIEHTTSPSGSPSLLSGDGGSDRDGTNNTQRATMNMAGSPVGNMKLGNSGMDPNRKALKGRRQVTENDAQAQSNQINNKSRRENNELSDQNNSSKNKGTKTIEKNSRKKSGKKNRKG